MAAAPRQLVRCSVTVEVGGRALPSASKDLGVELVSVGKGPPLLRVLGFKRDIRVAARDVQRVVDSKVADGRLALQCRDGNGKQTLQVVLSKAQPAQLELILRGLRGGDGCPSCAAGPGAEARAGGGGPPQKRPRMVATPAQGAPAGRAGPGARAAVGPGAAAGPETASGSACGASAVSLCDFSEEVLRLVVSFEAAGCLRRLWETCPLLDAFARARQPAFRLMPSRRAAVPPDLVIQRVARHTMIRELDLCGYQDLTASATKALADALGASGVLRKLCLRGCKGLTDAAVRRLLLSCPRLEMLDLLEVPRLTDRALEAPLGELRTLLVGALGRQQVAVESASVQNRRRMEGTVVALGSCAPSTQQPQQQRVLGTSDFTSTLLARFVRPPVDPASLGGQQVGAGAAALGGCPLEHAVFAHCAELMVLPRLPATLRHLDLRGASLQIPERAVASWRPLASCRQLAVLNLAHNRLLSGSAIAACVGSLPPSAALKALDLSETSADGGFLTTLPAKQPRLSHLRVSKCRGVSDGVLAALLGGLASLEVLDVSHCDALDEPFALVAAPPDVAATSALAPKLRLLGVGQTRLAVHIEESRRALRGVAHDAMVRPTAVDLFDGYSVLPPSLV